MFKEFLKNYLTKIILIIILIYFEASIDLKLPEYVSDMINIGVGQSGITTPIPKYLRKSQMDLLLKVTQDDEKILDYYYLSSEKDRQVINIINIETQDDVYILKPSKVFKDKQIELENLMMEPLKNLVALQNKKITFQIKVALNQELDKEQLQYFSNLYEDGSNLIDIIEQLPESLQTRLLAIVNQKASSMDNTVFSQAIYKLIINEYKSLGVDVEAIQKSYNTQIAKQILKLAIIDLILEIIVIKFAVLIATDMTKKFRNQIVEKVISLSEKKVNEIGISNLISRTINDTNQIEMIFPIIIQIIFYAPIIITKGLIIIFSKSTLSMSISIIMALVLAVVDIFILLLFAMPKFKDMKNIEEILKIKSRNFVNGAYVIRAFNQEKKEQNSFSKTNRKLRIRNTYINKILGLLVPTILLIVDVVVVYIVYNGAKNIDSGIMQTGEILEFIQIAIQIMISFLSLSVLAILLPTFLSSLNKIYTILKLENEELHKGTIQIDNLNEKLITFNNISLEINNRKILKNLNFSIKPGKINAIVGVTGSGKTSIINLLLQNEIPTDGNILIDNIDIRNYDINKLKQKIAISFQENYIFSGTLEYNFKLANKNITKDKMYKICEIANLNDFIELKQLKEKLDFEITNGGKNISGGQRQRISIANALAKDFDLLILDDSFSSLDIKTETEIRKAIRNNYPNKTQILISQKINTIKNAEHIIVLKNGEIVGEGNHQYLKEHCQEYMELIHIQDRKEEF